MERKEQVLTQAQQNQKGGSAMECKYEKDIREYCDSFDEEGNTARTWTNKPVRAT